jgi:hypothetical protein
MPQTGSIRAKTGTSNAMDPRAAILAGCTVIKVLKSIPYPGHHQTHAGAGAILIMGITILLTGLNGGWGAI